jgi:hypothetical protein
MKTTLATILIGLALCLTAAAQDKPTTAVAAAASGEVTLCGTGAGKDPGATSSECEKRDIARLFLIAGKPEAALYMLCNTKEARGTFRDDYQDGHNWIQADIPVKCLKVVGITPSK